MKKQTSENELVLVLCQPLYELSKIALDYIEATKKGTDIIILMLEDAELKLSTGRAKAHCHEILKSNIRKSITKEIFMVTKNDFTRLTAKEHNRIFSDCLKFLKNNYKNIEAGGLIYNGVTQSCHVFK